MASTNEPKSELSKDNTIPDYIETLLDILKTFESAKNDPQELCKILEKMKDSGLLPNLLDLLAHCESDVLSNLFISIIRRIEFCGDSKYFQILIDHAHYLKSSLQTPTIGMYSVFEALSWCDISIRAQIVNQDTLNYVLSNININNIQNDIQLATRQSRLLFVLIHLEYSVDGDFVVENLDCITNILNRLLTIQDTTILNNTLDCFKKLIVHTSNKIIPEHSMLGITTLLTSNNKESVKLALETINYTISETHKSSTFERLASIIQFFTKCNLWENLAIALNLFIQNQQESCVSITCNIIGQSLELVDPEVAEYMSHSMIKSNLFQNITKVVCEKKSEFNFKIFWRMMNYANEQDACFLLICMNIIPWLCDKQMYFALMQMIEKSNEDKPWLVQDSPLDVQCLVCHVLYRIVEFDVKYKLLNDDKNMCSKQMVRHGAVDLLETVRKEVGENQDGKFKQRKNAVSAMCTKLLKQLTKINDESVNRNDITLVVPCIMRRYNEESMEEIPKCVESTIEKFYLVTCDLIVPYLRMELDFNGMIIMNRKKICSCCQNVQINMKRCSGCKYVFYCNMLCQRKSWKAQHKSVCAEIKNTISIH